MLKPNTFISVTEAAKWARLNPKRYGAEGGVKATKTVGDLVLTAKFPGEDGNNISFELKTGGTAGAEAVTISNTSIEVVIEDGVSTAAQIKMKLDLSAAKYLITVATVAASNPQAIAAVDFLAGGVWGSEYDPFLIEIIEQIINTVTDMSEAVLCSNILARDYVDILDGSKTNVLIPGAWPMISVTSIILDTNRNFDTTPVLDPINYFLRGQVDKRQIPSVSLRIIGQDVVLRDDNLNTTFGKITTGSALGSVKVAYKAGWALDSTDVPSDIRMALLLAFEFFFMQRDNRDLNVHSKGVKGENYSKLEKTLPQQVLDLLEPYRDWSLGGHNVMQRNME